MAETASRILVLDDELIRRSRMQAALDAHPGRILATFAEDGASFLSEWARSAKTFSLLSLDHDLALDDLLDGVGVVRSLVESSTWKPPAIVHSSNGARAAIMMGDLELAGWTTACVVPFGEDWIESHWLPTVTRLLKQSNED